MGRRPFVMSPWVVSGPEGRRDDSSCGRAMPLAPKKKKPSQSEKVKKLSCELTKIMKSVAHATHHQLRRANGSEPAPLVKNIRSQTCNKKREDRNVNSNCNHQNLIWCFWIQFYVDFRMSDKRLAYDVAVKTVMFLRHSYLKVNLSIAIIKCHMNIKSLVRTPQKCVCY